MNYKCNCYYVDTNVQKFFKTQKRKNKISSNIVFVVYKTVNNEILFLNF